MCHKFSFMQYPFKLKIYTHSDTAKRLGIKNIPSQKVIKNLRSVHKHLTSKLLHNFGHRLILTSGYRCPRLNKEIGGRPNSQHLRGEAIDFEVLNLPNETLFQWCKKHLPYDQLIIEGYKENEGPHAGWIHCSFNKRGNRRMAFSIPNKKDRHRVRDIDKDHLRKQLEEIKKVQVALKKEQKKKQIVKPMTQTKVVKRKKNVLYGLFYLVRFLVKFLFRRK